MSSGLAISVILPPVSRGVCEGVLHGGGRTSDFIFYRSSSSSSSSSKWLLGYILNYIRPVLYGFGYKTISNTSKKSEDGDLYILIFWTLSIVLVSLKHGFTETGSLSVLR
jgi:hypothetical protein